MALSEKIQSLRRARGLSQEELAITLGVSRQAVSKWELGDATPDTDKVIALADYFKVTTDYLLRDGAPDPRQTDAACSSAAARTAHGAPLLLCLTLGGCGVGLLLLFYGRTVASSSLPSLFGAMVQILSVALAMGFGLYLRRSASAQDGQNFIRQFWRAGIWLTALLPLALVMRAVLGLIPMDALGWVYTRLPLALKPFASVALLATPLASYVLLCVIVTILLRKKSE